ncbi:MAG: HDIG domain-containing protein [Bacteroidales bacterium]|jgi:putative nucleotidyltransferase with HDIG domain|nr:HDIG domain-containing protein [Bacteroidales bacterium]
MANFLLFVRTHIYVILLYAVSIVAVCCLFPREGKFPYEFQKGKIWRHEDLLAPFDVPILKTEQEIGAEKDSLLHRSLLCYNYMPEVAERQKALFRQDFDTHWEQSVLSAHRHSDLLRQGLDLLDSAYGRGILQEEETPQFTAQTQLMVIRQNNIGEETNRRDIFTEKTAYEAVSAQLHRLKDENEREFMENMDINNYIHPNLLYNAELTNTMKSERIGRISPTKGVIKANSKIISRDETVNDEKFNLLTSLKYEFEHKVGNSGSYWRILAGQVCVIVLCFVMVYLFLMLFRQEVFHNIARTAFILLTMVLFVAVSCIVVKGDYFSLYVLPYILLPVIISSFFDARTATFIFTVTILLIGFLAPNAFEYVFLNFITGVVSITNVRAIYRRGALFRSVLWVVGTYAITYTALFLMQGTNLAQIDWMNYVRFGISGSLLFVFYPSIFIFEKMFGFISNITLMELSDTNQPLLRKLSEVAPGTFQHSLQVANIAEEVVQKIGGNPLLIRTAALYHDIGKLSRPIYFIENQAGGHNPHDELTPENSAQVIIEHVSTGVEIARKNRIPQHITDFIRTHHGTTTVRFFYHQYQKLHPDGKIERAKFSYPGPIPFSKEMVILMMCDSVEAASRSLKEQTQNAINDMVDNVVNYQIFEDQYNDADITYRDINRAKQIIKNRLMSIYHVRIEYPKD